MGAYNFKLVTKADNNQMAIYMVLPNGDSREICRVLLPADNQIQDNVTLSEELTAALKKRIRRSL